MKKNRLNKLKKMTVFVQFPVMRIEPTIIPFATIPLKLKKRKDCKKDLNLKIVVSLFHCQSFAETDFCMSLKIALLFLKKITENIIYEK